jgi:hypothetical protein
MAADVLARVRAEIDERMAELRPAVAEYQRLTGAADALESSPEAAPGALARAPAVRGRAGAGRHESPAVRATAKPTARAHPAVRPSGAARKRSAAKPRVGPVEQAIVAALEHGSHTLGELGIVTAISAAELRGGVRRLLAAGRITRASREGRAAYALSASA